MRARRGPAIRVIGALALVLGVLGVPGAARSAPLPDFTYVTMSDGTKISISIAYPNGFSPTDVDDWPVLFQMDGYGGGADVIAPGRFGHNYVTVYASVRGTGCSGGRFDLFDRRHALDGYEIIEWLGEGLAANELRPAQPKPPWSNGRVGIIGHSYPGLTGWMVASTNPPHLRAIAISGLIDDLYRGIVYPGGVPNYGFPAVWTVLARPAFEAGGNADRYANETSSGDPTCAANVATRPPRDLLDDPVLQGLTSQEDETWWQVRSTLTWVSGIRKPFHMTSQYQDEQTGPRAPVIFERIPQGVPKRLVLTNGIHATTAIAHQDRVRWLDCWVRDLCIGDIRSPASRVRLHFEQQSNGAPTNAAYVTSDYPAPETDWTRYHLCADGTLRTAPGSDCDGSQSYASTPQGRHATEVLGFAGPDGDDGAGQATFANGLPDELTWKVAFEEDTAVAGPINLTLHASSSSVNTDFFVDVLDVDAATGKAQYIQRGMQRASHRAIDDQRSDLVPSGPEAGSYYRAWHPHTNTMAPEALLTPGAPAKFEIEVFPIGHVFRAGHELVIRLHAPPPKDPLSIYAWVSGLPPSVNTVLHTAARPSSILLPVLPSLPPVSATPPACGALVGVPCFKPAL